MEHLKDVPITVVSSVDESYYGKFLQNEEKIRKLAASNPNSYAVVVVRSVDHFIMGRTLIEDHADNRYLQYNPSLAAPILREFSISIRSSELFTVLTQGLQRSLQNMVDDTLKDQKNKTSDLDRDARVCSTLLMTERDPAKAIKFLDISRKKYPNEVYFHRVYMDLFPYTKDLESGLKASEEVSKLFPNNSDVLYSRACFLLKMSDTDLPDFQNFARQKKQIDIVKEAYKSYLKVAPKDHRQFSESNHILAYLSFKYSTPSSQISHSDIQEISFHFQNGLNAEVDILPCFLPFHSGVKEFVTKFVNIKPPTYIDMTTHGIPGRPKSRTVPTENISSIDIRKPTARRIEICVPHRQMLKNLLSEPASAILTQLNGDQNIDSFSPSANNNDLGDSEYEEIVLYQMTVSKMSEVFTSKVIQLTVAEDSLYSKTSGFFEMVVADTTQDFIKLQLDLGTNSPDNRTLKELMKKFRFGTVWSLRSPDFHMENGDEKTMYIRAGPTSLIPINDDQNVRKCRACFKLLTPGQNCAKCKRAAYCGKACQTQDWKYIKHNLICSEALKNFYN